MALIASTRGMLGAGLGLLLAGRMTNGERKSVGTALLLVGVVTTIPLLMEVFGRSPRGLGSPAPAQLTH